MVMRRSYAKLKDAKDPHRLQVQKRATKVHAQRKFAQGAGLTNSPPAMTSAAREKDKPKMNGAGLTPGPVLPAKRPRTEDFITFLCFRGTDKLPPELSHFSTPSKPDKGERDVSSTGSSKHSLNTSEQESPKAKAKSNVIRQGRSPVLPLKSKIMDKRIAAKQNLALSKLGHKVRSSAVLRARQRTLPAEHQKKNKSSALSGKMSRTVHSTRSSHPSILKRLGASRLRTGLRSAGQLPPGSDDGIKTDRKPRESLEIKADKKVLPKKSEHKVNKPETSRKFQEKSVRMATRSKKKSPSPVQLPKTPNVASRPSRKTKEAATLYMEMITKDLRSPDDEDRAMSGRDESSREEIEIHNSNKAENTDRKTRGSTSKQQLPSTPLSSTVSGGRSSKRDSAAPSLLASPSKERVKRKDSSAEEAHSDKKRSVRKQPASEEEGKPSESQPAAPVTRRTRSTTLLESEDETPAPPTTVAKSLLIKPKSPVKKPAVKSDSKNSKPSLTKGKPIEKKLNSNIEVESSREVDKEPKKLTRSKSQKKQSNNDSEEDSPVRPKSPAKKPQTVKQETKTVRVTRSSTIEEDQPETVKIDGKKGMKRKPVKEEESQESEVPKRTRRNKKTDTESEDELEEKNVVSLKKSTRKCAEENEDASDVKKGKKLQALVPQKVKEENKDESVARRGRSSKKVDVAEVHKGRKEKSTVEDEEEDMKRRKAEVSKEVEVKKEVGKGRKKVKETEESDEDVSAQGVEPNKKDKQNEKPKEPPANQKSPKKSSAKASDEPTRPSRKSRKPAKSESEDSESEDISYCRRSSRRIAMKYNEESDSGEEEPVIPDRPKRSSRAVVHLYDVNSDSEDDFLTDNEEEEEYVEPKKEETPMSRTRKTNKPQSTDEDKENGSLVTTVTEISEIGPTSASKMEQKKIEDSLTECTPRDTKLETSINDDEKKQSASQLKNETKQVGIEAGTQICQKTDVPERLLPKVVPEEPQKTRRRTSREENPPTPQPTAAVVTSSASPASSVEPPKAAVPSKSQDTKVETVSDGSKEGAYNDLDTLAAAASLISLQTRKVILSRKSSTESSQTNLPVEKPKGVTEEKKAPSPSRDSDASTESSESELKVTRRKRLPRRLRREPARLQPPNRPVRSRRAKLTDSYLIDEDSFSSERSSSPEVMPSSKRQMSKLLKKTEEPEAPTSKINLTSEKMELTKTTSTSSPQAPFDPPIPVGKTLPRQRATPLPARPDQIDSEMVVLEKDISRKKSLEGDFDALKANLFNIKSISDNANVLATADIKPKPSIGDTWIQAFKNVKIPKPGQLSPAHHSSSAPFVRKPHPQAVTKADDLRRHAQQYPSTSAARLPNFQTLRVGHLQSTRSPKVVNQSPSRLSPQMSPSQPSSAAASPDRNSNVCSTPSKAPEEPKNDGPVPSKTLTHLQYEKRSQELISSLKDAPLPGNKYQNRPSEKDLPSRTSSPSLDDATKPVPEGGKHLNLPPVEHTLRKMSPITVSKKPVRVDKKSSPAPEVKSQPLSTGSKVEIKQVTNLELLNKMRVNMTHQEINGWMNDSTSSGIEHARDCGIFENNQCGCSFRTSGDSMRNSVSVTGLIVKEETKVDHGVVQPPVQLKELDAANNKFTAETISTCKVDDYKEKLMSKAHKTVESKKDAASQRSQKLPSKVFFDKTPKRKPSMTEEEMYGFDFRFERGSYSRESGSDMSSPTPRDDVSMSNEDSPNYSGMEQRKAIFHQRRAMMMAVAGGSGVTKRPSLSKSPSAFSAENESSVYAFEPDPPPPPSSIKQPFRRRGSRHKSSEEETVASSSIAVQVNFETEKVLECSTQTEQVENDGQLFYFPIEAESSPTQVIQGVQLKLQSAEGPDQRVFMKAKLVTKPSPTFPKPSTSRPMSQKPEQKVRPLASTTTKLPVGAVQPTVREPVHPAMFTSQGTTTSPQLANQSTQSSRPPSPPPASSASMKPLDLASKATATTPSIPSSPAPSTSSTVETSAAVQPPSKVCAKSNSRVKSASTSFIMPGSSAAIMDAPTFYPTEKEFLDPLEYIEQITPLARTFGMCRIVPPSTFKPECKVSDDMRFTAYNQYVHKMLHRWGPNVREMSAIKKYLATQSIVLNQLPWIGGMEIDLPRLYQTVQMCGGLKEVIEKKRWAKVADAMKIPKSAQDRVTKLDDIYCKYLLPYDTLSHEERSKLLSEVDMEWDAREKRLSDESLRDKDDSDSESDSDDRDECITKGRTMPLSGFYRIARNTMAMWFKETNPAAREVENEYWKHVTTRNSHICVNSGSIDTGTMGFGFPTSKTSTTSRHPWNLKVLTNSSGSVLRSIGPVIGVTVPTLHVGMLFSACCWYRDPHGLPWVEYLHTGASKIWYCVPDSLGEQLRSCMKRLLPRYCVDKPIWLASDTAMVPPDLLNQHGVSLCRTVQEPGQFVLVFPKAFTSTICTGYVVSESVYFAQPSWLANAKSIFKDIQESCEPPAFSLEKLLFNIASDSRTPLEVLNQVLPMIVELKETEMAQRRKVNDLGLVEAERLHLSKGRKRSQEDIEYECEICRGNLFLSLVREERPNSSEEEMNYCLVHAAEILEKDRSVLEHCKLMVTYEEEEMTELIEKLKSKIEMKTQKKYGKGGSSTCISKA